MRHHLGKKFVFRKIFFILAAVAVMSVLVMFLWNWLMPSIFHLPAIGFLQAAGILILSKIL